MHTSSQKTLEPGRLESTLITPSQFKAAALLVHGLTGDRDQGGRFVKLADSLADLGVASLRFDMRGRGNTQGTFTPSSAMDDVAAAADQLEREFPGCPKIMVARGEGAFYALHAAYSRDSFHQALFWAGILFPRTSRELQGDMHRYRENGYSEIHPPNQAKVVLTKEYYEDLERVPSIYSAIRSDLGMKFIHMPDDPIAPISQINEFMQKASLDATDLYEIDQDLRGLIPPRDSDSQYHSITIKVVADWLSSLE